MAHAQNCQVLFQIMMLTVMREEEIGLPAGLSPAVVQLPGGQTVQLQAAPDSLSLTPEQRQYLAKHCVVCKQYMPDPTSLKQHIRRKHPHIQIEQAAIQSRCRQLIRVEQGKCLFCDKSIKKARDHAPSCLVVFQACLSRHLIDHVGTTGGIRPPVPGPRTNGPELQPQQEAQARSGDAAAAQAKRQRKGKAGKGKSKARAGGWSSSWDTQSTDLDNTVYALARLCLRQEEELTELRQEKRFLLHMTTSQYGVLKPLVQSSIEWNSVRDAGKVTCNLRTCLFRLMLQELTARLRKLQESPQSISEATKALWVTESPLKWLYHRWNPALNKLEMDSTQAGLPQDRLLSLLEDMDAALKLDSTVLCQFKALRPLSEEMRGESVAFKISVALRGPAAANLHQGFAALDGCMALQLIGANLHRERQRQCREANLVRECVFGRPSSGRSY